MRNPEYKPVGKGRPPMKDGEDRRARILDCALRLFAEQGIRGTTAAQIAKASAVTPAMVNYYFGNREGLIDAVVNERFGPMLHGMWEGMDGDLPANPLVILETLIDRLVAAVEAMPELPALWSREVLYADGCLKGRITEKLPLAAMKNVLRTLAASQRDGQLHPGLNTEIFVFSIFSLIMVPLAASRDVEKFFGHPITRDQLADHTRALLQGPLFAGKANSGA